MMTCFYQTSAAGQMILLVISQLTVIALAVGVILLFRRRCAPWKQLRLGAVFAVNVAAYVVMQLDSRVTGMEPELHIHIPCGVLAAVTLLSLVFGIWVLLSETRNRRTIDHSSIQEAFDHLPTGVCFFNEAGLPVLCNLAMQRFSFSACGRDVQFITDLESILDEGFAPAGGARREGNLFILEDGSVFRLEKRCFTHDSGQRYTQYVAADVTDLHHNRVELTRENAQLRKVQEDLKRLSANMVAVTREEEILNTKMRVHDEMGRCLMAAQRYLREDNTESIPNQLAASWQRAVAMIKHSNDAPEEDMLLQIRKTCEYMKIAYIQTGALPENEHAAYLLTCALRECVTNAVRYAQATELYADFSETADRAAVTVSNNGKPPESEIVEGGGLSTLRRRVEQAGGTMTVRSLPRFRLTVAIPKEQEGVL